MYISQKIRIISTAEKIFVALRTNDNCSSSKDLAKQAIYASVTFYKLTDEMLNVKVPIDS